MGYTGALNLGLGIINLLPILPLDGGRVFMAILDWIFMGISAMKKKVYTPLDSKWMEAATAICGSALILFMLTLIVADIVAPISS